MSANKADRRRFLKVAGRPGWRRRGRRAGRVRARRPDPSRADGTGRGAAPAARRSPAAEAKPTTAAPAVKSSDKIVVHRYMTGGFTTPGPDDAQVKQIEEEALRKNYGLNVDIQFESATWADIDPLMELRLQTKGVDSLQRHHVSVLRWIATPGLIRDIDQQVKAYGKNLLEQMPAAPWQFFMRDDNKYIAVPSLRIAIHDTDYLHVRRDWLQKVNRDAPKTFEEFEEIMRLWKDKRLGGNVTIGVTAELGGGIWTTSVLPSPGRWHPMPDKYIANVQAGKSNTLENTWNLERLEMAQRWVKDGLLNGEWATWKTDDVYGAATKGMVGGIWGTWGMLNGKLKTVVMAADPSQTGSRSSRRLAARPSRTWAWSSRRDRSSERSWRRRGRRPPRRSSRWPTGRTRAGRTSRWPAGASRASTGSPTRTAASSTCGTPRTRSTPGCAGRPGCRSGSSRTTRCRPRRATRTPTRRSPRGSSNMLTRQVLTTPEAGEYPAIGTPDRYCPYVFAKSQSKQGDMDSMANEYLAKIYNGQAPPPRRRSTSSTTSG